MNLIKSVCVYCGSSPGVDPSYKAAAVQFGTQLANEDIALVYGGGNVGLMGAVADAAMAAGGQVIGVIPQHLLDFEVGKRDVSELIVVQTMHERKAKMAELADAFVALPGGVGTLEEIIEVSVWAQLNLHVKPCALLNINGYYASLIQFLDHMVESRFLKPEQRAYLTTVNRVEDLLEVLRDTKISPAMKWIDRKK